MESNKVVKTTWTEVYDGETSIYTLYEPFPHTKDGEQVARVRIWDDGEQFEVTEKIFKKEPAYREYYDQIKSPGPEYLNATEWYYVGSEVTGSHIYAPKEVRDRLLKGASGVDAGKPQDANT